MFRDKPRLGKLILRDISLDDILTRRAGNNNETSCKISLPKRFEGKKVIVLIPKEAR